MFSKVSDTQKLAQLLLRAEIAQFFCRDPKMPRAYPMVCTVVYIGIGEFLLTFRPRQVQPLEHVACYDGSNAFRLCLVMYFEYFEHRIACFHFYMSHNLQKPENPHGFPQNPPLSPAGQAGSDTEISPKFTTASATPRTCCVI